MQTKKTPFTVSDTSSGVSELIGGILMITVVVAAVAIIGVILFSQQTPEKIPNINFMSGSDNYNHLYLYHNGGDSLTKGTFSVRVDNAIRNDYSISDGGTEWSLGKNLILNNVPSGAHNVAIIYNATGSGEVLLRSASSNVSTLQNSINPSGAPATAVYLPGYINGSNPQEVVNFILGNTSLIGDAMNQSPSTVGPVIADVVGANSINFYREEQTTIDQNTYFYFNITSPQSTFSYGTTAIKNLDVGDIIVISQAKSNPGNWKIFGLGDQIWEFTADEVYVNWKHKSTGLWTNTTSSTTLYHAWIFGYQDVGSTLTLKTTQNGYTALIINSTKIIEGPSSNAVVIKNIRPVGIGLFVLEYDHNTNGVYFIGNAQSVTW